MILVAIEATTVEARKLEHDCPPAPKPKEEGSSYSNLLGTSIEGLI